MMSLAIALAIEQVLYTLSIQIALQIWDNELEQHKSESLLQHNRDTLAAWPPIKE
jgi:hypothetical protein